MADHTPRKSPSLAVLFWFYKDASVCRNHLRLFRQTNPDTVVYGLYGGSPDQEAEFRAALAPWLADFYTSPETDPHRKWRHCDLMITDWYRQRGQHLNWQNLFILQWDALIFTNLDAFFADRQPEQLFFSGYQPITPDWERSWFWTKPDNTIEHQEYQDFKTHLRALYPAETASDDCWHLCLFIFEVLTRDFLHRYSELSKPELGFHEYKIATYAHVWQYPIYRQELGLFGELTCATSARPVNAVGQEINEDLIEQNLHDPAGWRLFHPYFQEWKLVSD